MVRWILALAGVALVGIGAVGVFVPGLPTTIFLIGAIWCFARSCPWMERVLIRNRFFDPFLRTIDGTQPLTPRAKAVSIALMWAFAGTATFLLHQSGALVLPTVIAGSAGIGTLAVIRWKRPPIEPQANDPVRQRSFGHHGFKAR